MFSAALVAIFIARSEIALVATAPTEPRYAGRVNSASEKQVESEAQWTLELSTRQKVTLRWPANQFQAAFAVGDSIDVEVYVPEMTPFGKRADSRTGLRRVVTSDAKGIRWGWLNDDSDGVVGPFHYSIAPKHCQNNVGALLLKFRSSKIQVCEGQQKELVVDGTLYRITNFKSGFEQRIATSCAGGDCSSFFAGSDLMTFWVERVTRK